VVGLTSLVNGCARAAVVVDRSLALCVVLHARGRGEKAKGGLQLSHMRAGSSCAGWMATAPAPPLFIQTSVDDQKFP